LKQTWDYCNFNSAFLGITLQTLKQTPLRHTSVILNVHFSILFWEMIFWQPFFDNSWTTFSLILTWCCYSLSSFFSLYCFWPITSKKNKVVNKVVIKWMSKYHYSSFFSIWYFIVGYDGFCMMGFEGLSHQIFNNHTMRETQHFKIWSFHL
jgi:hypothetical protein